MKRERYIRERDGFLEVRVPYIDAEGKRKSVVRRVSNINEGRAVAAQIKTELGQSTSPRFASGLATFAELQAVYPRKMPKFYFDLFAAEFGARRVAEITPEMLVAFRKKRVAVPSKINGKPRKPASVNREMEALLRYFVFALKRGWIIRNPFNLADNLIDLKQERARTRIPTESEIESLLSNVSDESAYMRMFVLMACDTGLRREKVLGIKIGQVNLERRTINLGGVPSGAKRFPPVVAMTRKEA